MAKFYTVNNRNIEAETTISSIKKAGLIKTHEIIVQGFHANAYAAPGPDSAIKAVVVYAPTGYALTGKRV
jgi:hypothetical protein